VRVNIWDARGRVVYSDSTQLIGSMFPLGQDELRMVRGGGAKADASDLTRPENRSERGFDRLLEVYVGIRGPHGERLLYEDYERSSTIRHAAASSGWTVAGAAGRSARAVPGAGAARIFVGAASEISAT
jgi:two-component system, NarL family, sensor kinase